VRVSFLPPPPLAQQPAAGALVDYFLRRGLQELRLAQSFEDLVCLPSLTGVDSYVYQHETVRKVLRHFKAARCWRMKSAWVRPSKPAWC
jgi:hypothetical protein